MTAGLLRAAVAAALLLLLGACGSVQAPPERFFRLALPAPAGGELPKMGVLRVLDLQLGNSLSGDALLVADGAYRLQPRPLDHWIAPLDRLVTDALVLGLARTRAFTLVQGAGDAGPADVELGGRVLDFQEVRCQDGATACVALEVWGRGADRLLFRDEFRAAVPLHGTDPEVAVAGLSLALAQVLDQLIGRLRAEGVGARSVDATPPK
ncbi:MAG TPA: ABC-type transport auxiliary lipoprotein family protein [Planctomycetota bacterium]|nr:ABC-type transport auxiliary lipoprotein family protein [Planctomycetota bacterium]